jgi:hypothetical protein
VLPRSVQPPLPCVCARIAWLRGETKDRKGAAKESDYASIDMNQVGAAAAASLKLA